MPIDWNEPGEWLPFAATLIERVNDVCAISDIGPQSPEAELRYRKLGEPELWLQVDLAPPRDASRAGRWLYGMLLRLAEEEWGRYARPDGGRIAGSDRVPRVAFYIWARCVARHDLPDGHGRPPRRVHYKTGDNSANGNSIQIMSSYFETPVGPSAIAAYIPQHRISNGTRLAHNDVESWLKVFSRAAYVELTKATADLDVPPPEGRDQELLRQLVPARLADAMAKNIRGEFNEMQRWALARLGDVVSKRASLLITAPTGTGKSKIGQVALAHGAHDQRATAVSILPLKALVTQEAEDWAQLITAAKSSWPVLPASRDYPENDAKIANGRFKVALAIYETIGAFMTIGARPLDNARVLLVDELQYMGDAGERGFKLESLLTLIKLIPEGSRPAIIGLSATLRPDAAGPLVRWLGVQPENISPHAERPVPMDAHVLATRPDEGGNYLDYFQPDAHLATGRRLGALPEVELRTHEYCNIARALPRFVGIGEPEKIAAVLVRNLLEDNGDRRILVFVRSRSAATRLVEIIGRILNQSTKLPKAGKDDPWTTGRFADRDAPHDVAVTQDLEALQNQGLDPTGDLTAWLRSGVAAHSAQFSHQLRRRVEQEFLNPSGLLRVIVATDTLAIGMNLPADTVIATRVTGYVGRAEESVLTAAEMDNKAGRAGRLGKTDVKRGTFYLITPPSEGDLDRASATDEQVRRLTEPLQVFREYIVNPARSTKISSHFRELRDLARFALTALCWRNTGPLPRERLAAEVRQIIGATLRAAEVGGDLSRLPAAEDVLDELEANDLINSRRRDELELTGLGRAIGRAGLPLEMTAAVERIARLAGDGLGPLELLYETANTEYVHETIKWVAIPRDRPDKIAELVDNLRDYVDIYAQDQDKRAQNDRYVMGKHEIKTSVRRDEKLLTAASISAESELAALTDSDQEALDVKQADALLRAIVAFEWAYGERFDHIRSRLTKVVSPDIPLGTTPRERQRNNQEKQKATLKLYNPDVTQLCEQLASVLAAAAEAVDSVVHPDAQVRMRSLAASVGAGVPPEWVRLANLRIPTLHRERLVGIRAIARLDDLEWEEASDLVGQHVNERERERIARLYEEDLTGQGHLFRHMLFQNYYSTEIGEDDDLETLGEWLETAGEQEDILAYRQMWRELAELLGISCTDGRGPDEQCWSMPGTSLAVRIPDGRVDANLVDSPGDGIVICWRGMTDRAVAKLAHTSTGRRRFLEPREVAETIAAVLRHPAELESEEHRKALAILRHLADGTQPASPPPSYGDRPMPSPDRSKGTLDDAEPVDSPE